MFMGRLLNFANFSRRLEILPVKFRMRYIELMNKSQVKKRSQLSMTDYIKYRNGVPLGASGSLQNMLSRSLGAGSFAKFWQYWNPIWGYTLGRYIYAPLNQILPASVALILTFTISGAVHDLATMLVRRAPAFFFTPWFFLMSLIVICGQLFKLDYSKRTFPFRVAINLTFIIGCLTITMIWTSSLPI
jgi:hypothetical protein